ncbi:hypothetical protein Tco_0737330 [Tanacetum coccineum]
MPVSSPFNLVLSPLVTWVCIHCLSASSHTLGACQFHTTHVSLLYKRRAIMPCSEPMNLSLMSLRSAERHAAMYRQSSTLLPVEMCWELTLNVDFLNGSHLLCFEANLAAAETLCTSNPGEEAVKYKSPTMVAYILLGGLVGGIGVAACLAMRASMDADMGGSMGSLSLLLYQSSSFVSSEASSPSSPSAGESAVGEASISIRLISTERHHLLGHGSPGAMASESYNGTWLIHSPGVRGYGTFLGVADDVLSDDMANL